MKFIAVILSVYILSLTAMPCDDYPGDISNSISMEFVDQSQYHTDDVDLCSPFCFCNCCQTLAQPISKKATEIKIVINKSFEVYKNQDYNNPDISIWHPPKI